MTLLQVRDSVPPPDRSARWRHIFRMQPAVHAELGQAGCLLQVQPIHQQP